MIATTAKLRDRQPVTVVDDKPAESPEEAERRRKELLEWDEKRRKAVENLATVIGDGSDLSKFGLLGALDS